MTPTQQFTHRLRSVLGTAALKIWGTRAGSQRGVELTPEEVREFADVLSADEVAAAIDDIALTPGPVGADGEDGASAYEIAVANGFVGDEAAWLASLIGLDGADGADGATGATGPAGPNLITVATATDLVGVFYGDGSNAGVLNIGDGLSYADGVLSADGIGGDLGATANAIVRRGADSATAQGSAVTIGDTGSLALPALAEIGLKSNSAFVGGGSTSQYVLALRLASPNQTIITASLAETGDMKVRSVLAEYGPVTAPTNQGFVIAGGWGVFVAASNYGNRTYVSSVYNVELVHANTYTARIRNANGNLGDLELGKVTATAQSAATCPATIKGAASHSVNLTEWQFSTGSVAASINSSGWVNAAIYISSANYLYGQNGNITLRTHTGASSFNLLRFGSPFNTNPALKISGTTISCRLADDSADSPFSASSASFSGPMSVGPITKSALLALTPSATAGEYRITDSTPAQRRAYPDGTDWRYSDDSTVVT